jgi:small-conductance mechanosensitive channel
MDLQEKRKLDSERLTGQLANVKARARPWRSVFALILAIAAAVVSNLQNLPNFHVPGQATEKIIVAGTSAAFCVFAVSATLGLSGRARDVLEPRVGSSHAAVVRYTILLVGGIATFVITLQLFRIAVGQVVLGGALTAVLLGIAGQQSMANLFAGIVLLLSRPFNVGERVRIRSGAMGGIFDGLVTEIGITYVRLDTGDGVLALPNSQMLAAAVGPLPPAPARPPGPAVQGYPPPPASQSPGTGTPQPPVLRPHGGHTAARVGPRGAFPRRGPRGCADAKRPFSIRNRPARERGYVRGR